MASGGKSFLDHEKARHIALKRDARLFTAQARDDGPYRGKLRPFCLPAGLAAENLFAGVRRTAISYFRRYGITWHDGKSDLPSNHLCDSQVCCVNFLFPFSDNPEALRALMRSLYPDMVKLVPMEEEERHISFEWIGRENYLKERTRGERTRGANCTSSDAAFMYERADGGRSIVLIEWKYTESYSSVDFHFSKSGTDRTEIYRWLWEDPECPLQRKRVERFEDLFFEPFYQLMRLQFLAWRMAKARELGAQRVSVLHIAPRKNEKFQAVTSPGLRSVGTSVKEVWQKLQACPDRFKSVCTEDLFGRFDARPFGLEQWQEYVSKRYELT